MPGRPGGAAAHHVRDGAVVVDDAGRLRAAVPRRGARRRAHPAVGGGAWRGAGAPGGRREPRSQRRPTRARSQEIGPLTRTRWIVAVLVALWAAWSPPAEAADKP